MSLDPKSSYYDAGGIETINIIRAKLTHDQWIGYLLGNIIKYSCRMNWKGQALRDAEKIRTYRKLLGEALLVSAKEATSDRVGVSEKAPETICETTL